MNILTEAPIANLNMYNQYKDMAKIQANLRLTKPVGGLQTLGAWYVIHNYLTGTVVTPEKVEEAVAVWEQRGIPFDPEPWNVLIKKHQGRLPLRICALPERHPFGETREFIYFTVENIDVTFAWLVPYLDFVFMRVVPFMSAATASHRLSVAARQWFGEKHVNSSDFFFCESDRIEAQVAHLLNFNVSQRSEGFNYLRPFVKKSKITTSLMKDSSIQDISFERMGYSQTKAKLSEILSEPLTHDQMITWNVNDNWRLLRENLLRYAENLMSSNNALILRLNGCNDTHTFFSNVVDIMSGLGMKHEDGKYINKTNLRFLYGTPLSQESILAALQKVRGQIEDYLWIHDNTAGPILSFEYSINYMMTNNGMPVEQLSSATVDGYSNRLLGYNIDYARIVNTDAGRIRNTLRVIFSNGDIVTTEHIEKAREELLHNGGIQPF